MAPAPKRTSRKTKLLVGVGTALLGTVLWLLKEAASFASEQGYSSLSTRYWPAILKLVAEEHLVAIALLAFLSGAALVATAWILLDHWSDTPRTTPRGARRLRDAWSVGLATLLLSATGATVLFTMASGISAAISAPQPYAFKLTCSRAPLPVGRPIVLAVADPETPKPLFDLTEETVLALEDGQAPAEFCTLTNLNAPSTVRFEYVAYIKRGADTNRRMDYPWLVVLVADQLPVEPENARSFYMVSRFKEPIRVQFGEVTSENQSKRWPVDRNMAGFLLAPGSAG